MTWIVAAIVLLLCYLSIRRRLWNKSMKMRAESASAQVQPVGSPLSESLTELVGVAGGVYIAANAFFAFLKITTPEQATIMGISFDPVALASIVIAIIQPYFVSHRK